MTDRDSQTTTGGVSTRAQAVAAAEETARVGAGHIIGLLCADPHFYHHDVQQALGSLHDVIEEWIIENNKAETTTRKINA